MHDNMRRGYQKFGKAFDNLEDYINESIKFDNLELKNFRTIFAFYFSCLLLNLILYIIAQLSNHNIFTTSLSVLKNSLGYIVFK